MNYTVRWRRSATNALANIWNQAPDRQAVTDAANRIDRELARDPSNLGESRSRGRRIVIDLPLAVIFKVDEARRRVLVVRVRRLQPRP
jgi:hypothetical protein